jgi:hypothetical protein
VLVFQKKSVCFIDWRDIYNRTRVGCDDVFVDLQSFDIVLGINGAIDMIEEPELAESDIEEGNPDREGCIDT